MAAFVTGVIVAVNSATLTIRNQGDATANPVAQVKSRDNTYRSLMPEGFEGLGVEGLRDNIIVLMASGEGHGQATE